MNYYSSEDMVVLVAEISYKRLPRILGDLAKRSGGMNPLTERDTATLKPARILLDRFIRGEFRHTDSDEDKIKAVMDWLVVKWSEIRRHSPRMDYAFDKSKLRRREPLPKDYWDTALQRMANGDV